MMCPIVWPSFDTWSFIKCLLRCSNTEFCFKLIKKVLKSFPSSKQFAMSPTRNEKPA